MMNVLVGAFGAGEIGDRQINEDRSPSCTPFVWARPEDERGAAVRQGSDFFVGRFRNTQSSPIGTCFAGIGTHGSIKSEARRDPLCPWKWPSLFQ